MRSENKFDHIQLGKTLKFFVYPPYSIPETLGFEDALKQVIPSKLKLLLKRASVLKNIKKIKIGHISKKTKSGTFSEYFNTTIVLYEYSEYYAIQKWINYWLKLWYSVSPQELPASLKISLNTLSEVEIEQARRAPIENYYEGTLRKAGARLIGLCSFHVENSPSFNIFPDNRWHCFGACSEGGDVITYIMKSKKLSFPETVRYLL